MLNNKHLYILCLVFIIVVYCDQPVIAQEDNRLQFSGVKIIARDVFESAKWYARNLDFRVKKHRSGEYTILKKGDFTIHIVSAKRTITINQIDLPINKERINGFHEIGFLCSDLDSLMYQYEGRGVRKLKDLSYESDYQTETVILSDPDGNRIKLFQATSQEKNMFHYFKPKYVLITTSDIETGSRWYKENLGFKETKNNYPERARISYCLLEKDGLTIELQELYGRTMELTELLSDQVELTRFDIITISNKKDELMSGLTDNDGNKLRY